MKSELPPINETKFHWINRSSAKGIGTLDTALFYLLTLLVLLIEIRIVQLWLNKDMDTFIFIGIHGGVVAMLGFWTIMLHRFGHSQQLPPLLTLFTGVMGPFGIGGTLVATGLYYWFKRSSTPFSEWYQSLFPDFEDAVIRDIFHKAVSTKDFYMEKQPVTPFLDVLHYGTTKQKQAMIVILINHHHGKFAGVLRKALEDKEGSVRVLAAKGMAKIEQHYMDRNMELENLYRERKISSFELMKSQILNNDEYIYSGILDDIRETDVRLRTIKSCKKYLDQNPDDLDIRFIVGRMLLRGGKDNHAAEWYEDCLHQGFTSPKIFVWYFECLYRMGQFNKLRKQSAIYFEEIEQYKHVFQPDIFQVIQAWAEPKVESQQESDSNEDTEQIDTQGITSIIKTKTA